MGMKQDGQTWTIKEQIIEDFASGLTLQFEVVPEDLEAPFRLKIFGDSPYGNREIMFGRDGKEAGLGIVLAGIGRPSWLPSSDEFLATD